MKISKKLLAGLIVFSLIGAAFATIPVLAGTEASVSATVTPKIIAVTVSDGSVDYGILDFGATKDTIALTDTQTISRSTSNVPINIAVRSSDADGTSQDWELVTSTLAPGVEKFVHRYVINAGGTPAWADFPADATFDNTYTGTVATLDAANPSDLLDLKIQMPSGSTDTSLHTITVTVRATGV